MEEFKQRVLQEGIIVSDQVLKLDTVLNQQVDPQLMMKAGEEFASRFQEKQITKVLTIESSGISLAFSTAYSLGVPLIFARRKKTLMSDKEVYCERVPSFTKGIVTDIVINRDLLLASDKVLIIDDIIANGDAIRGLLRIIERAGSQLIGIGVAVEKAFQSGARTIREQGIHLESLVNIISLENNQIELE